MLIAGPHETVRLKVCFQVLETIFTYIAIFESVYIAI